jgi:mannose/cellobiose epimerase-like protein (N-acyl-D-glucosamine 2-epimerase family)
VHLTYRGLDGAYLPREDRHIVATSRFAYALAKYASLVGKETPSGIAAIERANAYVDFIWNKMVHEDKLGYYLARAVDENGTILEGNDTLNVEQQAYGLSGLVALYGVTQAPELLEKIEKLYRGFFVRFHDSMYGGFYDKFNRGKNSAFDETLQIFPKSFNSTAYVVSSFLYELAKLRVIFHGLPRPIETLTEVALTMAYRFPDPKTGWIFENFKQSWSPFWHGWQKYGDDGLASVGHNFQAAWLLLQVAELPESAARSLNRVPKGTDPPGNDRNFMDRVRPRQHACN